MCSHVSVSCASLLQKKQLAWQQCGVEERRKGWQLLLRRLPAAARSLSSHLFTHAHKSHVRATFFRRAPTAEHATYKTVWHRAKRGNKKLEKILSSRALFVGFLVAQDGLLHAAGIPALKANLVWTDSRSDKTPALCPD